MKRILFLFNILFAVVLVAQAQPKITFDKNVQELGYVFWRNPVTITYNFTNTGDKPLVISKVTSSCGCTEVDWTKFSDTCRWKRYGNSRFRRRGYRTFL